MLTFLDQANVLHICLLQFEKEDNLWVLKRVLTRVSNFSDYKKLSIHDCKIIYPIIVMKESFRARDLAKCREFILVL